MSDPGDALHTLAAVLEDERSVISPHVRRPAPGLEPALGRLVAAGPRSAASPGEYALAFESIREGYLLHYAEPRLLADVDPDLALLAGDHLYALGLARLTALGDLGAIRELADLISLCAQVHGETERGASRVAAESQALWLGSAVAVAAGRDDSHERAKALLRAGDEEAAAALRTAAAEAGDRSRLGELLEPTADAINLATHPSP